MDTEYWSKYPNVIDEKRERLWAALLEGLQKYQYVFLSLDRDQVRMKIN